MCVCVCVMVCNLRMPNDQPSCVSASTQTNINLITVLPPAPQLTTLKAQVSLKRSNSSLQRSDSNSTAPPPQTTTTQPPLPTASIAGSISAATSDADPNSRPVSRTNSKRASFAPEPTVVTSQAPPSNSLPQLKAQAVQILASMDSQAQFTPPPALEPLNEDSDEQNSDDEEDDDCDTPTNPNIHRTTFMFGRRSMNR